MAISSYFVSCKASSVLCPSEESDGVVGSVRLEFLSAPTQKHPALTGPALALFGDPQHSLEEIIERVVVREGITDLHEDVDEFRERKIQNMLRVLEKRFEFVEHAPERTLVSGGLGEGDE